MEVLPLLLVVLYSVASHRVSHPHFHGYTQGDLFPYQSTPPHHFGSYHGHRQPFQPFRPPQSQDAPDDFMAIQPNLGEPDTFPQEDPTLPAATLENRQMLDSSAEQVEVKPLVKNVTGLGRTITVEKVSYVAVGKFCRDESKERNRLDGDSEEECAAHCAKDSPHCVVFSFDGQQCTLFQETEDVRIPCSSPEDFLVDFYFQHTLNGQGHPPATNVAIGRKADSSGTCMDGDANVAVDGRIDGNFFSSCEGQTYPWWRLDLGKAYQVLVVVIADEKINPRVLLHDLVVRVGYSDIAYLKPDDKIFQENAVCISLVERILAPGLHRLACRTPLEGKYVSIQMVKSCGDLRGCDRPHENILRLSEVEVWTRPLAPDSRMQLHNVALGKLAKQSSESPGGIASLAIDGILSIIMQDENTGVLHCTKTQDEGESNPWWQVDLINKHVVKKVIIFNRGEGVSSLLHDFQVRVGNDDISEAEGDIFTENSLCIQVGQSPPAGPTEYQCKNAFTKGRFVSVQIIRPCLECKQAPLNILTLCEVEVMGYRIHLGSIVEEENVALLQPTLQSSQNAEGVPGLAVDGYVPVTSLEDGQQRCTSTADSDDVFPWWRVDLSEVYIINSLDLFVEDSGFHLHDVEIRVGGADIALAFPDTAFSSNSFCAELGTNAVGRAKTDATLLANGGRLSAECIKPTEGRFVSLQVVRACGGIDCEPDTPNVLNLCEVRVYGFIKEHDEDVSNVALHHVSMMSSQDVGHMAALAVDGRHGTRIEHCARSKVERFPWWLVDLSSIYLIKSVSLYNTPDAMSWLLHDVEVRVGDTNSMASGSFNLSGILCGEMLNQQLPGGRTDFVCLYPLSGRFVSVQIIRLCTALGCDSPDSNQLTLCEVEVMGQPVISGPQLTKRGMGSPEPQPIAATQIHQPKNFSQQSEHVVPGGVKAFCYINPLYRPPSICPSTTEVGLDLYPWWRVDLGEECHVYKIIIHNTDKLYHAHLHDFEIRVGNEDIWRQPRNSVFAGNALCISFAHSILPAGYSVLKCNQPHTGRFVSIQIVRACQIDACRFQRVNILSLCQVVVWGAPPSQEHLGLHNVALMRDVEQSSLAKGGMPNWAVDGIFTEEIKKFDLKDNIVLKKINLINNGKKAVRLQDVQVRVHEVDVPSDTIHILLSHGLCVSVPTFTLLPGTNPMTCNSSPLGRYVTVLFRIVCEGEECDDPQSGLSEVEIWGHTENETRVELSNVALHHPAEQSSLYMHGAARLAVDGYVPSLRHKNETEDIQQCTSTARIGRDLLPWWRVDLHQVFYIHKVVIFNQGFDGQSNLHDIQIRVGKLDISKTPYNSIFDSNPLCVKKDDMLPGGRHDFVCNPPLRGRFVSIQIVGEGCEKCPLTKNVLSLCEVEVWASPTTIMARNAKNVALHKPVGQSSTSVQFQNALADLAVDGYYDIKFEEDELVQCSLTDETDSFPWWRVDLMGEFVVETLMIYNREGPLHSQLHDLEIRVGHEDVHVSPSGRIDRNAICVQTPGEMLPAGETELDCSEPITGRYVTIQVFKPCDYAMCMDGPNVLSLCEVEVLGTPRQTH